jgi:xylulokinase
MKTVLVLNMGLKSIRSIVWRSDGIKLSSVSLPIETYIGNDRVVQNPDEWWEKACRVITESLRIMMCHSIDCMTVTASSSCLLAIDNRGNALDNCAMVSDKRAREFCPVLEGAKNFPKVLKDTGLKVDASLMLPKILWYRKYRLDIYAKTHKFISPNDYLIGKLTGNYVTDKLSASKYHFARNTYPVDLLKELGIAPEVLPDVVDVGSFVGCISEEKAKLLNLNKDLKIYATSYDAICSFLGSGVSEEGDASDVSGTATSFRVLTKKRLPQTKELFVMPFREMQILGGSNNLGGGLIEWCKQSYYSNEQYPYEIMEKEAGEIDTGANGLIFLPYLLGERAPLWNSEVRGAFFGLEREHSRREMTRAIFESTGFILRDFIQAAENTGVEVKKVTLSGGLARNNLVSQIKADIIGRDVLVLEDFETTAAGAAMLLLTGSGDFTDCKNLTENFVNVRMIIKPDMRRKAKYDKIYAFYKKLYFDTEQLFVERNKLFNELYRRKELILQNL